MALSSALCGVSGTCSLRPLIWGAMPGPHADSPCCDARPSCCRTIPGRTLEQPAFEHAILRGLDKHGHAGDKKTSKGWWKRYGVVTMHDAVVARLRNNNFEVGSLPFAVEHPLSGALSSENPCGIVCLPLHN